MESYPAISVVLCTYNGGKYLASQIDSILAQTYPNFELIICDDVSVDHTVDILQQYAKKDRRIRIFLNKFNLGFNKNFEQALQLATGKWIAIADQDDVWVPQKLAVLYNLVDDHHWLIHSYNAEFKNDNIQESVINRSRVRFEGNEVAKLFFYNTI